MTDVARSRVRSGAADIERDLHAAILDELTARGMQDPERLAVALGVALLTARALLRRSSWSLDVASWIIDKLDLPVTVSVTRDPGAAAANQKTR